MEAVRALAERLMDIPGVVAVTLGGSRAGGLIAAESDWDFGLYYRDAIRADDVRGLGFAGTVVEPGSWGRLMNGGASLTVDEQRVELVFRDLDVVRHWLAEAEAGGYEVDQVDGYLAGMPTGGGTRARGASWRASYPDRGFPTRFGGPLWNAGDAAPASRSPSPTGRGHATTWSHARDYSPGRHRGRPSDPR
jgi:hypothetical protein